MNRWQAGRRYRRLLANLVAIQPLLRNNDLSFWADWMADSEAEVRTHDRHGLNRIKSAYGGMGSFNDIYYPALADGERIEQLKEAIWDDADALLRDLNRKP